MMTEIAVQQMPAFKRAYKKLHPKSKLIIDEAIQSIIKNPEIGEEKKGDLGGVFGYKFKMEDQQVLLAYE